MNDNRMVSTSEHPLVGQTVNFQQGKSEGYVAWYVDGRAILAVNPIQKGFATVQRVVNDADRYIRVVAEHIIKDLFVGMTIAELRLVIAKYGFQVEVEQHESPKPGEIQFLAFHPETGAVLFVESNNQQSSIYTADLTVPNIPGFKFAWMHSFAGGSGDYAHFDLLVPNRDMYGLENLMQRIQEVSEGPGWSHGTLITRLPQYAAETDWRANLMRQAQEKGTPEFRRLVFDSAMESFVPTQLRCIQELQLANGFIKIAVGRTFPIHKQDPNSGQITVFMGKGSPLTLDAATVAGYFKLE